MPVDLIKPPALVPPARVGIVAPGSAPLEPDFLKRGLAHLRDAGFEPVTARDRVEPHGYLAGTDDDRAQELNGMLSRDDLDALICVRGGYGSLRILDRVDYAVARARPKLLVGYSDITALQLALFEKAGLMSVSGPMAAVEWRDPDEASTAQFMDLVSGNAGAQLTAPDGSRMTSLVNGSAEGRLLGGNLTLISRLVGTPFLPDLTGAILFLEEIGESPYRVDGYLAHLRLSGILDAVAGILIGGFTEAEPEPGKPSLTLDQIFEHYFGDLGVPVARDFPYGHFPVKSAIPVGVRARLEVSSTDTTLTLLEQVVRD